MHNLISCKDYYKSEIERLSKKDFSDINFNIFQVGNDPASNAYVKGKMKDCAAVGVNAILHKYENISETSLGAAMVHVIDGPMMLQLPVPANINYKELVRTCMFPSQDVDGMYYNEYEPCTPRGIMDWLAENDVDLNGKTVAIIGRSDLVGRPLAKLMLDANATVVVCHSRTREEDLRAVCESADIVVSAVGKPHFLDMNWNEDQIIIDVGISRINGKLVGDVVDNNCGAYITPVPGGVGLLTRIALLKNIVGE